MNDSAPKAGKLLKHSTIYAIGTILRQLTSFLMLPVYTRFLSPTDYGVVGLLSFTLALMEPFFGARLGDALPKFYLEKDDPDNHRTVLSTALTVTGIVSGATALIIFVCKSPASTLLFGNNTFGLVVGLFGFQILTQAIEYYGLTFLRIRQQPLIFITVSLSKLIVQLGLNIWLIAFLKLGVMGVIISGGVSSAVYALGLTCYMLYATGYHFDLAVAKRMLKFSWPLWFSGLAGLYIWQSNRFYIRIFGSLEDIGLYELAMKFASILTFLAWTPFTQVWDVERFNYYRTNPASDIFGSAFHMIAVMLITIALGISIFSTPAIHIMASVGFHRAAISVPFLTLASLFSCLLLFLNFSFLVSGSTKWITINNYATMAVITALNLALIPKLGGLGAAIALMLAMVFQFFLTEKTAKKYFDMRPKIKRLAWPLLIGIAGYLLANDIFNTTSLWLGLIVKVLIYTACVALLAHSIWRDAAVRPFMETLLKPIASRLPKLKR